MTFEWSTIEKFCRVKDGRFRGRKTFGAAPCHQTHPVVFESGGATLPSAGLIGGDCGQDQGIDVIFPASLDKYSSESMRHFRVKLVWIDRRNRPYVFLRGSTRDLQPQRKRQYGPGFHIALLPRKPRFGKLLFKAKAGEESCRRIGVSAYRRMFPGEKSAPFSLPD